MENNYQFYIYRSFVTYSHLSHNLLIAPVILDYILMHHCSLKMSINKCLGSSVNTTILFSVHFSTDSQHFWYSKSLCADNIGHLLVPGDQIVIMVVFKWNYSVWQCGLCQSQTVRYGKKTSPNSCVS